ncbi:MAG: chlorite dismutase family protein [Polyangiaceae bacterium]|nr:chlorite dismutase family protein [Polyangiaceae bacterium]
MSHGAPESSGVDVRERGAAKDGVPQTLDQRLFMQLTCFQCGPTLPPPRAVERLAARLESAGMPSVIYEDVNHPRGVAVLGFSEDPADFVEKLRPASSDEELVGLAVRPELGMIGRTYSTGFEQDLAFWLLERPRATVLNAAWPWAIWYPLRRKGEFERLDPKEKAGIMREHGGIGRTYGDADLAHDVRLACHGLDQADNDFVIGLVGKELFPLSHVVQSMRRTRQTAEYMEKMGPFFVGRAVWRHAGR